MPPKQELDVEMMPNDQSESGAKKHRPGSASPTSQKQQEAKNNTSSNDGRPVEVRDEEKPAGSKTKPTTTTTSGEQGVKDDEQKMLSLRHHQIVAELSIETLRESETSMGVVLTWDLVSRSSSSSSGPVRLARELDNYAQILDSVREYQIYGCQGTSNVCLTANSDKWILVAFYLLLLLAFHLVRIIKDFMCCFGSLLFLLLLS